MFAVIEIGGRQYIVKNGDTIVVEKIDGKPSKEITAAKVLLYDRGEKGVEIGRPHLKDVKVTCELTEQLKGPKLISYKYRRRKATHRMIGHRQQLTRLKVKSIE